MAAIAGISKPGASGQVSSMLEKMSHRGKDKIKIIEDVKTTSGISWIDSEDNDVAAFLKENKFCDFKGNGHFAWAQPEGDTFLLSRDQFGVAPLYYGRDPGGHFCFASEVKGLLPFTTGIKEVMPGCILHGETPQLGDKYKFPEIQKSDDPNQMAIMLKQILEKSVQSFIRNEPLGAWLSGGLDSSTICVLASGHIGRLMTFSAGLRGAPDLDYAREVANFLHSRHHEVFISVGEMIRSLPEVIYHLESFDALLVRSSITNFIVAKKASQYVSRVFSGEGGDELFAGYEYLQSLHEDLLSAELVKITGNLHNTALQRVDRCSSAHGTIAHVPFLHREVVDFAFSIPVQYKLKGNTGKWILRKAMEGELPDRIVNRPKVKFWDGAGVGENISSYADEKIKDIDFKRERTLGNGWILNTKEELLYYRIFRDHFGDDLSLDWMGRTEGSPVA